jgi:hypothetical protein
MTNENNTADAAKIAAEDAYYDAPLNRVAAPAPAATVDDVYLARLTAALQLEDKTYAKHESARIAYLAAKNYGTTTDIALAADEVEYRWSLCNAATKRVEAVRMTAPTAAAYFAK